MTNHERKHLPADMAGLDGLIELLRADLPEVLCEKHWMVDFDAVEAQRVEAATQLQAFAARIEALEAENERLRGALKRIQHFSPAHMWRAPAIKEIASGALREKP